MCVLYICVLCGGRDIYEWWTFGNVYESRVNEGIPVRTTDVGEPGNRKEDPDQGGTPKGGSTGVEGGGSPGIKTKRSVG